MSTYTSLLKDVELPLTYSVFLPENTAFDVLHPVELSYLQTRFGRNDRAHLLHRHVAKEILYRKNLKKGGTTYSLEGEKIRYELSDGDILVDGANITQGDIVARNGTSLDNHPLTSGVVHIISNLTIPESVVFTPLKYLYGMHDITFAETLAASDSVSLANDSSIHQTILAPTNEAYADSISSEEVLNEILYNFVDSAIDLDRLNHNDLLATKYTLNSLDGRAQRIKVTKRHNKTLLNNQVEVLPEAGICSYIAS